MTDAPTTPVVSTNTVSTTTTVYSLLGDDGITITCNVLNDSVQVTSDDVNGFANSIFRNTSLAALIAVLTEIQTAASPPAT